MKWIGGAGRCCMIINVMVRHVPILTSCIPSTAMNNFRLLIENWDFIMVELARVAFCEEPRTGSCVALSISLTPIIHFILTAWSKNFLYQQNRNAKRWMLRVLAIQDPSIRTHGIIWGFTFRRSITASPVSFLVVLKQELHRVSKPIPHLFRAHISVGAKNFVSGTRNFLNFQQGPYSIQRTHGILRDLTTTLTPQEQRWALRRSTRHLSVNVFDFELHMLFPGKGVEPPEVIKKTALQLENE